VELVDLMVETEEDTLDSFEELVELVDLVVDTEEDTLDSFDVVVVIEELLELLLVVEIPVLLLDLTLAHTSCVCPISHAPLMLNDSNTMLSIAFRFAPEKTVNGTVYV
jgi:hypothetical protein